MRGRTKAAAFQKLGFWPSAQQMPKSRAMLTDATNLSARMHRGITDPDDDVFFYCCGHELFFNCEVVVGDELNLLAPKNFSSFAGGQLGRQLHPGLAPLLQPNAVEFTGASGVRSTTSDVRALTKRCVILHRTLEDPWPQFGWSEVANQMRFFATS